MDGREKGTLPPDVEHPGRTERYCTVICNVAVLLIVPEVAVIVTVLVPDGVPGLEGVLPPLPPLPPLLPPPQPIRAAPRVRATTNPNHRLQRTT